METPPKEYVVRNSLAYAYEALRSKERLMGETTTSYYENYFQQLLERLGPPGKKWELAIPNSEVESFYLGGVSLGEFRLNTTKRVFSKVPGWEFAPFSSLIWSECCSAPDKLSLCSKLDSGIGRQIWEVFLSLDVESQGKIHIDDICDLIQRILRENGHVESEQNIKEWFCDEKLIDFWSFFAAIVKNYSGLLKPNIIRSLHELIFSEVLFSGKLTKKGHKIHSWKERWFILQPTLLSYFESHETMVLKGTIAIGVSTQLEFMPDSKSHQRRFRIVDCQNQVPYEICTPDVTSLQQWNHGIQVAIAMNKVSGTSFLHQLTLAQKQVFSENSAFAISAVTPSKLTTPPSPNSHAPLSPSKSAPLTKSPFPPQPPSPYGKNKVAKEFQHQSSKGEPPNESFDDPPPVPRQNFEAVAVVMREKPRPLGITDIKARRRHSSINYSSEFEKEQEREREKLEHVNVGGDMYAVVSKPASKKPALPERGNSQKEIRRILPKTPSPSAQRKGYIELEFQNGMSNLKSAQNPLPVPRRGGIPPDSRTKFNYTKVVFETEGRKEKEREFENDGETAKKNKPLPPTPLPHSSASDSNILVPQPAPRHKKPKSLVDVQKSNSKSLDYTALDFSPTQQPASVNGGAAGIASKAKRVPPKLPPKQPSLESPVQPQPRPVPAPRRVMSPTSEAPPPLPARRSPLPPP